MKLTILNLNKMNKLISMTEFVVKQYKKDILSIQWRVRIHSYAKFLQQPLILGMFVPCVDGVPIEDPNRDAERYFGDWGLSNWSKDNHAYKKAKEEVIFEGWKVGLGATKINTRIVGDGFQLFFNGSGSINYNTVEDLLNAYINGYFQESEPTLTKTALKQIGR